MITREQIEGLMDESNPIFELGVEGWLDEVQIESDAFIYLCDRLANVLKIGIAQHAAEAIVSGEEVDPEEVLDASVQAGMGVAVLVGWMIKERLGTNKHRWQ